MYIISQDGLSTYDFTQFNCLKIIKRTTTKVVSGEIQKTNIPNEYHLVGTHKDNKIGTVYLGIYIDDDKNPSNELKDLCQVIISTLKRVGWVRIPEEKQLFKKGNDV